MGLPFRPPVEHMLAELRRQLPSGPGWWFEPKWDGFRALVFRDGDEVELFSRNQRPLARYFPELVQAVLDVPDQAHVVDAEIVVTVDSHADFGALLARLHPAAARVARLSRETPALLIAFDVLAATGEDLRQLPFAARRRRLFTLLEGQPPPLQLTSGTTDSAVARCWLEHPPDGVDGVVAKRTATAYEHGRRAMVKVKPELTADCVVGGFRWMLDRPGVASLLLGLYDGPDLRHVGVVASLPLKERLHLAERLWPYVQPLEGHPWEKGFGLGASPTGRLGGAPGRWAPDMVLDWVPLRPVLVCEVAYDHVDDHRLRHAAQLRRWRPDRDARSCTIDQLDRPPGPPLAEALA